jgi:hypothetical protein
VAETERAVRGLGDGGWAVLMGGVGGGGMIFYLWLGYALLHEGAPAEVRDGRVGWLGKRRRHGRIVFGRQAA